VHVPFGAGVVPADGRRWELSTEYDDEREMCGLAGIWRADGARGEELEAAVRRMAGRLVHRGPDDAESALGLWAVLVLQSWRKRWLA
jgi:glutamate synthase domain-containing protein 1